MVGRVLGKMHELYKLVFLFMTTIKELQNWVNEDWELYSKEKPSVTLQILYLMEEFGEVAEALRKLSAQKARMPEAPDLGSELADLVVSVVTLANTYQIDLETELEGFKERLAARHNQGY